MGWRSRRERVVRVSSLQNQLRSYVAIIPDSHVLAGTPDTHPCRHSSRRWFSSILNSNELCPLHLLPPSVHTLRPFHRVTISRPSLSPSPSLQLSSSPRLPIALEIAFLFPLPIGHSVTRSLALFALVHVPAQAAQATHIAKSPRGSRLADKTFSSANAPLRLTKRWIVSGMP